MAINYTKYASGGVITYDGNMTYTITSDTRIDSMPSIINQLSIGTNQQEKMLFAMTCHVFGIDTPELIASFRKEYDKIKSRQGDTDEQVYEFLIKAAYEVKYGTNTD